MFQFLRIDVRQLALFAVVFVLSTVAVLAWFTQVFSATMSRFLSIEDNTNALAGASCTVTDESDEESYFAGCGGLF